VDRAEEAQGEGDDGGEQEAGLRVEGGPAGAAVLQVALHLVHLVGVGGHGGLRDDGEGHLGGGDEGLLGLRGGGEGLGDNSSSRTSSCLTLSSFCWEQMGLVMTVIVKDF
jgi:hypothetical protein